MMNVVIHAKDKHTIFNRDLCDKYNYECKTEKISYYIYSLLEAVVVVAQYLYWWHFDGHIPVSKGSNPFKNFEKYSR